MVHHIKANEPASLLLTLTPYKTAIHARITSDPEKDFPAFINSDIQHIGDDPRTVPGYWFLHVDYKHKKDIPELSSTDLLPKVIQALSRKVAVIKSGVPMIDVFFCRKQDLDAIAPENRHEIIAQDFRYDVMVNEHTRNSDVKLNLFQGIRTDRGLHLFSQDANGQEGIRNFLHYYGNNFFNKQRPCNSLEIVTVYPLGNPPTIGKEISKMEIHKYLPSKLPKVIFCKDPALICITEHWFDMRPTLSNQRKIMTQNDLSYLQTNTRVHDFMCLAYLHEGICTHTRELPKDNINEFSHQDRFCSMMQELDAAQGSPRTEEIGKRVRELAGRILKKDFKNLHYRREPARAETQEHLISNPDDTPELSAYPKLKM